MFDKKSGAAVVCFMILVVIVSVSIPAVAERIGSGDLVYKGAFRLPNSPEWEYSGYAMTYYPKGDPGGANDGYSGSLFIIGHDHHQMVSEITIPAPVISAGKDVNELNAAVTIQRMTDVRSGIFMELEIPRAGLAYLPKQGSQEKDKLHFCWGQHFQDNEPSHGWCELTLSDPGTAGPWYFGEFSNYATNDYLFEIPKEWASKNTPGQYLATGRFRDGQWGGKGPTLFAYGPWNEGDPPSPNARLERITPILLYGIQEPGAVEITNYDNMKMKYYKDADEWSGGSWLTAKNKSALVFLGTKAMGRVWYGYANGVVFPISGDENEVYPEVPPWPYDDRGWWSEDIQAQIIFYDTDELAEVVKGVKKTYEPQPYAVLDIDKYLYDPGYDHKRSKRYLVGGVSFDRSTGTLYVVERRADEDRSLIHVWQIR